MNKKQKVFLWIGIAVIAAMGLFPPVRVQRYSSTRTHMTAHSYIRYQFLLNTRGEVVTANLCAEWMIATTITGWLIYRFKDKKEKNPKGE